MRCVVFTGAGGNEVVEYLDRPDPTPGSEELLVRVAFAGLNPADLSQRAGHYPAPPGFPSDVPGLEVSGVVEAVGAQVLGFAPGDRVFGLVGGGGLAELVTVHHRCVARVPEALDARAAAAVPEAYITAHDAIRTRGGLRPGETILVHGANGGVGSAALQIALAVGARVLGTVRSETAAGFVRSLGGEPVPDDGFADAVLEVTAGRGADVILELVGAPHFPDNLRALAVRGRIVVVGVGAGHEVDLSLRAMMQKRAELHGTVLRARPLEEKAAALRSFEKEVLPHLASGRLRATVDSVFPGAEARAAFDRLEGPGKTGKVLLAFG
jgi:putative PIG3 family NAD(P)H quinone oxidoreductase